LALPELRQALAAADMLVLPSDYESFGLVIAEAMAAGKPVVATRSPGPSAVVRHGVTGYLVAHEDYGGIARHAIHLLENPLLAKAMGEAGRCEAEQYRVDGIIDRFESLYVELLANRRRGI
jgi:glycosyltransferase involved in cell wall biosynthesis